ncbi:hypothetical protein [Methylobacterium sp. JK268]
MPDIVRVLQSADTATLDEIRRGSEAHLAAQLTVALAGNQRAMTFFGFLAAASAVIAGASVTAIATVSPLAPLGYGGLIVVVGFLISMAMANLAALPDAFEYVGNTPSSWLDDITGEKSLSLSRAEMLAQDDRCIAHNHSVLKRSARFTKFAMWTAWSSLASGLCASVFAYGLTHA